jgi:hypothetical protein
MTTDRPDATGAARLTTTEVPVSATPQYPNAQLAAGHIPSALIPPGADPRSVVIVQEAPRSYTGPIVLVLVSSACAAGIVLLLCLLLEIASATATTVAAAAPAGVGVSVALRRSR